MSFLARLSALAQGALAEIAVSYATVPLSGFQNVVGLLEGPLGGRRSAGDTLRRWRPGDRLPILFCHGYMGDRTNFIALRRRLHAAGFRSQASVWLNPYWRGCEAYVARLETRLDAVLDATGAPAADLVAHSMGGVAARGLIARPGRETLVRRLVTLGTPHAGTPAAYAMLAPFDRSAADIRPGSAFLRALGRDLERLPAGKVLSVFSNWDQVVPTASSVVPAPQANLLVEDVGHGTLLYSRRVARAVAEALPAPRARLEVLEAPPLLGTAPRAALSGSAA
jgi:pimeloyl-ACP methyl ester carboxylesterase